MAEQRARDEACGQPIDDVLEHFASFGIRGRIADVADFARVSQVLLLRHEGPLSQLEQAIYSLYIRRMPTTVHIPDELLEKLDERAQAMKMTRNRYIVEALRKALRDESAWSPAFLESLDQLQTLEGVDELERVILGGRTRKRAPRL